MSHKANKNDAGGAIISLVALLSAAAFLFIGLTMGTWHPTWLIFLSIPIVSIIVDGVTKRSFAKSITGIVPIVCVLVYLYLGFFHHLWHVAWLVFFAVPIVHIIAKLFSANQTPIDGTNTDKPQP